MESLEKAIRTAFDKGDPLDPAYRKRVYRSALTALEKSASANPSVTEEVAASRREKLKDVIRSIETEFRPAAAPASQPELQPEPPAAQEPPVEAEAADVPTVEASVPEVAPVEADVAPDVEPVDATVPEVEPVAAVAPEADSAPEIVAEEAAAVPADVPTVEVETAAEAVEPAAEVAEPEHEPLLDVPLMEEDMLEPEPQVLEPQPPQAETPAPNVLPEASSGQALDEEVAPVVDEPRAAEDRGGWRRKARAAAAEELKPEPEPESRSRGMMLPFLIGLAILIGGGAFLYYKYGGTAVPTSETASRGESSAPALRNEQDERANWIAVFDAGDPSTVTASAGTELEILDRDEEKSLRVNAKGNKSATVTFEVGQGIMRDLAGKQAVFDIAARAQEGKMVEISVECDFGSSGGCGRQRYEVGFSPGDYLFDVQIPDGAGGAAGKIIVRPDSAGSGAFIDISAMRATVPDAQ